MHSQFWAEYAHVQRLVELGHARDEQLDRLLEDHPTEDTSFDLYDSRRLKNFNRNSLRKERLRSALLRSHSYRFDRPSVEPHNVANENEKTAAVRQVVGGQWRMLHDTLDGDYAGAAIARGMAIGTLKSRVSRAKGALKLVLRQYDSDDA